MAQAVKPLLLAALVSVLFTGAAAGGWTTLGSGAFQDLSDVLQEGNSAGTNDIDLNNNQLLQFFASACGSGQAIKSISDDGSFTCIDISGTAGGAFVNESGDTMTGTLDMSGNMIDNVGALNMNNPLSDGNVSNTLTICPDGTCDKTNFETFDAGGIGTTNIYTGSGGEVDFQGHVNMNGNDLRGLVSLQDQSNNELMRFDDTNDDVNMTGGFLLPLGPDAW